MVYDLWSIVDSTSGIGNNIQHTNEVRSSLFPWRKLCACSLLHFIFCWLHWISLVVVILEVDALEGVACYYLTNFALLELVFLSNRDIDKCSTDELMLRPACADPLVINRRRC